LKSREKKNISHFHCQHQQSDYIKAGLK